MAMCFVLCENTSVSRLVAFPAAVFCVTNSYDPQRHGACKNGERDAGSGRREVKNSSTPNRLEWHPIIGLIHEIDHACFWVMPYNMFKVFAWFCFAKIDREPVGKHSGAGHRKASIVKYNKLKRIDSLFSLYDLRIRDIGILFGQGQRANLYKNNSKKNYQQCFNTFQYKEN